MFKKSELTIENVIIFILGLIVAVVVIFAIAMNRDSMIKLLEYFFGRA